MEEKILNENNEPTASAVQPLPENVSPRELAQAIAEVLDEKKGHDIQLMYVEKKTIIADWFVICTGGSSTHLRSLVDEVEFKIEQRGVKPLRIEGRGNGSWVILDYASVIVHIFSREAREFYNIEKLYEDAVGAKE